MARFLIASDKYALNARLEGPRQCRTAPGKAHQCSLVLPRENPPAGHRATLPHSIRSSPAKMLLRAGGRKAKARSFVSYSRERSKLTTASSVSLEASIERRVVEVGRCCGVEADLRLPPPESSSSDSSESRSRFATAWWP